MEKIILVGDCGLGVSTAGEANTLSGERHFICSWIAVLAESDERRSRSVEDWLHLMVLGSTSFCVLFLAHPILLASPA